MTYKLTDFENDYSEEEDYIGREDELAFAHTLSSAYGGNAEYMRVLGDIYSSNGHGVKQDFGKAVYWYEKGAAAGDLPSALRLADLYYGCDKVERDFNKAFVLYDKAKEGGSAHALSRLGQMYLNGWGTEKDQAQARSLLQRAAEQGDREACYEYAHLIREEDGEKSAEYLQKAAAQSYGKAAWELAQGLLGQESADVKALMRYLTAAAYGGYAEAAFTVAEYYMNGVRVGKNLNYAKSYYLLAAELGDERAVNALEKYFGIKN